MNTFKLKLRLLFSFGKRKNNVNAGGNLFLAFEVLTSKAIVTHRFYVLVYSDQRRMYNVETPLIKASCLE